MSTPVRVVSVRRIPPTTPTPGDGPVAAVSGTEIVQSTPSASWLFLHSLGRRPSVTVYDSNGEELLAEVHTTLTSINVLFSAAMTGSVVIV